MKKVHDIRAKRGYEVGSDHYLVVMDMEMDKGYKNIKEQTKNRTLDYTNIKVHKLQEEKSRERYQEKHAKEIARNKEKLINADVEEKWSILENLLKSSAEEVYGVTRSTNKKKQTPWWNQETKEKTNKKKRL